MPRDDSAILINHLTKEDGVLKNPIIIDAFKSINRADFVPENMRQFAYLDEAISIGGGQTISQPYTVAFMLELLDPEPGEKILDIGAGSGWQTSLLAHIVSQPEKEKKFGIFSGGGKVFAMEVVPELCKLGKKNLLKFDFMERGAIEWICGDASKGLEKEAPFDKIIAAAALVDKIPQEWKDQLKVGGKIVVPINNSIWLFEKKGEDDFEQKEYPGFVFVPFVEKY